MWTSRSYGKITYEQMFDIIKWRMQKNPDDFTVFVGTDSQGHKSKAVVVEVIVIYQEGKGGFFFYKKHSVPRFSDLRTKIYYETTKSLDLAKQVTNTMIERDLFTDFIIHVDIGNNKKKGKTYELIPEIMGWIQAEGYEARYKPDSPAASAIADMLSK